MDAKVEYGARSAKRLPVLYERLPLLDLMRLPVLQIVMNSDERQGKPIIGLHHRLPIMMQQLLHFP